MRHLITTSFIILALVISAAGAAPAAHATFLGDCSTAPTDTTSTCIDGHSQSGICNKGTCVAAVTCSVYGATCTSTSITDGVCGNDGDGGYLCISQSNPNNSVKAGAKQPDTKDPNTLITEMIVTVVNWIVSIFAWFLGIAILALNMSVSYSVVNMGSYVTKLTAVGVTWRILRDIGNIMFIFGFLAVGISVILNSEWYGGGMKKMLPMLIVGAVFLNFSLFITEAIIDTGNLFATQIYTQINGGNTPSGLKESWTEKGAITDLIMNRLGVQSLYNTSKEKGNAFGGGNVIILGILSIILFIVMAFVMFSLAFILLFRLVALIFLIILAPLGFAGLAIPQLAPTAKRWWDTLFEQTITAPVLILLLYIALLVITDNNFIIDQSNPNWMGTIANGSGKFDLPGFGSILISFLVAMGLLLAVVVSAKKLSAFGANTAMKIGGKLSFGAMAFAGRRTVGKVSNRVAKRIRANKTFGATEAGRLFGGIADRGAKASFDVRGTGALKNLPGGGIDAGSAQKGGYRKIEDDAIKARQVWADSLEVRDQTEEEKKEIADAKAKVIATTAKHTEAKNAHSTAGKEYEKQEKEVKRIKEEHDQLPEHKIILDLETAHQTLLAKAPPTNSTEFDERKAEADRLVEATERERMLLANHETTRNLADAQAALLNKEHEREAANTQMTQAEKDKAEAIGRANEITNRIEEAIGTKKTIKDEYAESQSKWTTGFGSDAVRREASKRIKKEKSTKEQLADLIMKRKREEDDAKGPPQPQPQSPPQPQSQPPAPRSKP